MPENYRKKPYPLVSRRVATLTWKYSKLALESIVFASKKWIEAFRAPPNRDDEENAGVQSALRSAMPVHQGLDGKFEEALDDVMARFTKALEHLAK